MSLSPWVASLRDDLLFARQRLLVGVESLSADDLDWRPVPTVMTAREQLAHVAFAEALWRGRCQGESEPPPAAPADETVLEQLDEQRRLTLAWLAGLTEVDLVRAFVVPEGHTVSLAWVLNHLVRHDAHHAGQLILLGRLRHPDATIASRYDRILAAL